MAKWIKIETHTPEKNELRHIARRCGCSKADAFLAFFRLFVWLDEETDDGHVEFFTRQDADEIAGALHVGADGVAGAEVVVDEIAGVDVMLDVAQAQRVADLVGQQTAEQVQVVQGPAVAVDVEIDTRDGARVGADVVRL